MIDGIESIEEKFTRLEKENTRLNNELTEARKIIDMVENNTLMPHKHTDNQTKLYCLAERAREFKEKSLSEG